MLKRVEANRQQKKEFSDEKVGIGLENSFICNFLMIWRLRKLHLMKKSANRLQKTAKTSSDVIDSKRKKFWLQHRLRWRSLRSSECCCWKSLIYNSTMTRRRRKSWKSFISFSPCWTRMLRTQREIKDRLAEFHTRTIWKVFQHVTPPPVELFLSRLDMFISLFIGILATVQP